jgi:Ca2+-binding RTX toxin-like protein
VSLSPGGDGDTFTGILETDGELITSDADFLIYARGRAETVGEGESLSFSVIRSGDSNANLSVDWAISGDDIDAADIDGPLSGTVEFQAGGADVRTVTIDIADDGAAEAAEDLIFTLSNVSFTSASDLEAGLGTSEIGATITDASPLRINGNNGAELIEGNNGDDFLFGRGGDDSIEGGGGDDTIIGGAGEDRLEGGEGADVFAFLLGATAEADTIADFGPGDRLAFDDRLFGLGDGEIDARPLTLSDFRFILSLGTVGYDRDVDADTTTILYDSDGPGTGDPRSPIVILDGAPDLTLGDLLLF